MQNSLTSRELEVFNLLLEGNPPKEIAYKLGVTYYTVNFHRNTIYRKLGVRNIQELLVKYKNHQNKVYVNNKKPAAAFTMEIIDTINLYTNRWEKENCYGEGWNSYDEITFPDIYTGKFTDLLPSKRGDCIKFLISGTVDKRIQWVSLVFTYVVDDVSIPYNERLIYLAGGKKDKFADIGPGEFNKVEIEVYINEGIDIHTLMESTQGYIRAQFVNALSYLIHEGSSSDPDVIAGTFDNGQRIPDDVLNHQIVATLSDLVIEPF
jgi:DNA-binding CsgD family transcriptional regulator